DGVAGDAGVQVALGHPHGDEEPEGGDEEVPGAAGGIEDAEIGDAVRPAGKTARYGAAVIAQPEVQHLDGEGGVRVAALPPRAERVVEEEVDHVALGKELRHGRKRVGTDLVA